MEGFVLKKGFATRFNRRWFVLEQQYLSYYESFAQEKDEPINLRGVLQLRDAEITNEPFKNRPNVLRIRTQEKRTAYLDCEDDSYLKSWQSALETAKALHLEISNAQQYERSLKQLGIPIDKEISERDIVVAYKRASLKVKGIVKMRTTHRADVPTNAQHHPDKGGDVDQFNAINLAYTQAKDYLENRIARSAARLVEYEALIEKGGPGVGIGLVVTEDRLNNEISVSRVLENCLIRGLSEEADGRILPDDILIGINNDDTSGWQLTRLKARLNNFRAPVGSLLRLSFRRYVLQQENETINPVPTSNPVASQRRSTPRVGEQLGSGNLETPLPILLTNTELDGVVEEDDDDEVKGEWSDERKLLRKEIRRLRRSLYQVEGASVISHMSDESSVMPTSTEIELRREVEILRHHCREYSNAASGTEERLRFQTEQIDQLMGENAEQRAEIVQLQTHRTQVESNTPAKNQELDELQHNYRRVMSDLHDAEEKVRELQRQLVAESQFRDALVQKTTLQTNEELPRHAVQELMDQVVMLQKERDAAIRERQLYRRLLHEQLQNASTDGNCARTWTQNNQQLHSVRLRAMVEKYSAALRFD